jgi:outer membrane protein OmpA-like peptidoglycan-associated protein
MAERRTGTSGTAEILMVVTILIAVATGTVATYWLRSLDAEAGAATPATAPAPRARTAALAPAAGEALHADIHFEFKSTRLSVGAVRLLQERAALIAGDAGWVVLVQGQADLQGPAAYNRHLALRRVETVRRFLVELGVPEASVRAAVLGPEGALCDDAARGCEALNRRVHLEVRRLGPPTGGAAAPVRPALAVGDVLDTPVTPAAAR